jgi:asparagine synthetase B (glutamine-hydrolysing)
MVRFLLEIPLKKQTDDISGLFITKPEINLHLSEHDFDFMAWGDPVCNSNFIQELKQNRNVEFIVNNLYGHYYYIFLDKITHELFIGNSLFSILPVYFSTCKDDLIISENAFSAGRYTRSSTLSKKFLIETFLFNYPLFNHSAVEGVSLLSSNSYFSVKENSLKIIRHTCVEDLFTATPLSWRKSTVHMTDVFLETVKRYLPEQYFNSLTGGFDGRTLAAAGLYCKKSFSCYCFGSDTSGDMSIASSLASSAGLPFAGIPLDREYCEKDSLRNGLEFIINSSGVGTFARAHYLYAVKKLSAQTACLVTGNFGSEIFRAVHVPGVVIAPNLVRVFSESDIETAFQQIEKSHEFSFLNAGEIKSELEDLKQDLSRLPCFNKKYKNFTRNQQFYVFVLEELFRKYFGTEMINQFCYLRNRTPFLDIDFIRELFNTGFAGIHSEFFEHNPFKRYKGQILYAHVIRKAFPQFGDIKTDKGYKPDDLLTFSGKLRVAQGYMKKQITRRHSPADPYGVSKAFAFNQDYFRKLPVRNMVFNEDLAEKETLGRPSASLIKFYSLVYLDYYYKNFIGKIND